MSKIGNMPGMAWLVIGVLVTLLVIPTTAYAAGALKFTGIEGTSTNKADVTSAGQLLTTEAKPTSYQSYFTDVGDTPPSQQAYCAALTPALPAGDAYDVQDVYADFGATGQQTTVGSTVYTSAGASFVVAPPSANVCTTFDYSAALGLAIPPGGNTGTVALPQHPGFVIPNGYQLYAYLYYASAAVFANGYLIPSSDAPRLPAVQAHGQASLLPKPNG
jgi:hypothetical protein